MLNLYKNTDGLIHLYKSSNFQSFSAWVLNAVVMFSSCNLLLRLPVLLRSQIIFDTHLWFFWFVHIKEHLLLFVSLFMCGRKILQLDIDCIFLLDDKILTFFNYFRIGKRYYQNLMKVTVLIGRKSIFFPAETLYNVEIISVCLNYWGTNCFYSFVTPTKRISVDGSSPW